MKRTPEAFEMLQVWTSPRGTIYRVVDLKEKDVVVLRQGVEGRGRALRKKRHDVRGWTFESFIS